jgi:hypothetical protein
VQKDSSGAVAGGVRVFGEGGVNPQTLLQVVKPQALPLSRDPGLRSQRKNLIERLCEESEEVDSMVDEIVERRMRALFKEEPWLIEIRESKGAIVLKFMFAYADKDDGSYESKWIEKRIPLLDLLCNSKEVIDHKAPFDVIFDECFEPEAKHNKWHVYEKTLKQAVKWAEAQ